MQSISPRILAIHEAVTDICCRAIATRDGRDVFDHVCNVFVDRNIYSAVSIGISDKQAERAKTVAQAGLHDFRTELQLSDFPELHRGSYYVCNDLALARNEALWVAEVGKHGFRSMAVFPVKIANNVVAVFSLYSRDENTFMADELSIIERVGGIISNTIVHMRVDDHKKHAEMELHRREAIYSRAAERMIGTICEIDQERRLTFVSESQRRVLGFEPEGIMGKTLTDFIHPECLSSFYGTLQRADQSHSTETTEIRIKRSNGEYAWMEMMGDAIVDEKGHISGFVVALRDITEPKQKVEELERYTRELEERVKERTQRIRTLNENASQRVMRAINQINHISEIRDRLRKNPGLKSGFELIVGSVIRDLAMDAGGIFIVNPAERTVEVEYFTPCKKSTVKTKYALDEPFIEFETLNKKEPISRNVGNAESILGTESIHCAPISISNRVHGFLALGSDVSQTLDESDTSILNLYSALITTLLKSTNLNVEPAKELIDPVLRQCRVNFGNSYLVPDNVALAYELFLEAIMSGTEGLCITRTMPVRVRERYKLQRTPIIWLTGEVIDGEKTIHSLQDLSILISNYVQKATKPVILIDGMEYLISQQGFQSVYHLMQAKRTQMEASRGILIVPFFREAIEVKEAKLMEREFVVFGTASEMYATT